MLLCCRPKKKRQNGQQRPNPLPAKFVPFLEKPTHINFGTLPNSETPLHRRCPSNFPSARPWILRHSEAYKLPSLAFNFRLFQANAQTRLKCWRMLATGVGGGRGQKGAGWTLAPPKNVKDSAGHGVYGDLWTGNTIAKRFQAAFAYRTNRFNFTPRWHFFPFATALKSTLSSIKFLISNNLFPHFKLT